MFKNNFTRVVAALALSAPMVSVVSVAATVQSLPRMITTNSLESAPLNSVNRSFARLAAELSDSVDSERLSYRMTGLPGAHADNELVESALKRLLINVYADGDTSEDSVETSVKNLSEVDRSEKNTSTDEPIASELDSFTKLQLFSKDRADDGKDLVENFRAAVKSALTRDDIQLYAARITISGEESHLLILRDEETNDVLVLDLMNTSVVSE